MCNVKITYRCITNFREEKGMKLVDEGKDVVMIAHSYGGSPMSQCTKGLSKTEREAEGKEGGIVRLAYMTALVPGLGMTSAEIMAAVPEDKKLALQPDVHLFCPPQRRAKIS